MTAATVFLVIGGILFTVWLVGAVLVTAAIGKEFFND